MYRTEEEEGVMTSRVESNVTHTGQAGYTVTLVYADLLFLPPFGTVGPLPLPTLSVNNK